MEADLVKLCDDKSGRTLIINRPSTLHQRLGMTFFFLPEAYNIFPAEIVRAYCPR
jgi:hypothetical protein